MQGARFVNQCPYVPPIKWYWWPRRLIPCEHPNRHILFYEWVLAFVACLSMARVTPAPLNLWIGRHTPITHAHNRNQAPFLTFRQAIWSKRELAMKFNA